jgi:hypothetical protein
VLSGAPPVSERPAVDEGPTSGTENRAPHPAILLSLFLVIAIGPTFPNVTLRRTFIAGGYLVELTR